MPSSASIRPPGRPKWAVPFTATDHWVASPLVVDDTIYAPNNNGTLYAIKLATGELAWSLPISRHSLWGTPATDGKLIYVGSLDHFLYAVDPALPQDRLEDRPRRFHPRCSADVGRWEEPLCRFLCPQGLRCRSRLREPSAGRQTSRTGSGVRPLSTVTRSLRPISVGNLYSLGAPSGKNAWPEVKPDGAITASPLAIPDGVVVATESGFLYAFKPDGSTLWPAANIGGKIYTTPVVIG